MSLAQEFSKLVQESDVTLSLQAKLLDRTATYADAQAYAKEIAKICKKLSDRFPLTALESYSTDYLSAVIKLGQEAVNEACMEVQTALNELNSIRIKAAEVKPDADRVSNLVDRIKTAEKADDVKFLTDLPVMQNIMQSAVTDNIQKNVERQASYGVTTYVTRSTGGGCCDWCESMAGTYAYGDWPEDFWLAHRNCTCQWVTHTARGKVVSRSSFATKNGKFSRVQTDE